MDDALIVVIAFIAIVGSVIKKAKKTAEKRPGQAQKPQAAPPKKAKRDAQGTSFDPVNWEEAFPPEVREILTKERGKSTAKKYTPKPKSAPASAAKPAAEGASPVFADGCVGGSMPHGADAEGKSAAYADGCVGGSLPHDDKPRQRAALREQAPDTRPVLLDATSHVQSQPKLTAAEMRRAVITAEVLARPVALRPHGHRL